MLKNPFKTFTYFYNYSGKNYWSFLKLIICIVTIIFFGNNFHIYKERPTKNITIFIHGTLMPFLALLNPLKTYAQTIKPKDWYYKCLQTLRGDSDLLHDSIILEEGLKKIDPLILYQCSKLHSGFSKTGFSNKGAYKAIGAYDMISQIVHKNTEDDENSSSYYTFGFNGLLSHFHRKEAALKFYAEITQLISECLKSGYKPILNLCGYSHGGNLILLLAHAELIHQQNLQIDRIVLFGTPIQAETAIYANHPMFSKIYNFFSEGDNVQNSDSFSTSSASSYRTFEELSKAHNLEILSKNIYDIRLLIGEDPLVLGHFSYWFFNKYSDSWTNNYALPVQAVLNSIYPFPIAVFSPIFLDLIEKNVASDIHKFDINFQAAEKFLEIRLLDTTTQKNIGTTGNVYSTFSAIKRYTGPPSLRSDTNNSSITTMLKNVGASINTIISGITE